MSVLYGRTEHRPLETEEDLIAAAQERGGVIAQALIQIKQDHTDNEFDCYLCADRNTERIFESRRAAYARDMSVFGVDEWQPHLRF